MELEYIKVDASKFSNCACDKKITWVNLEMICNLSANSKLIQVVDIV